jgi:signal transduction histidine kinase
LATVVQGALEDCAVEIRESKARIESSPPWPKVLAHAPTLRQILVNLISNAVKFVGPNPARVRLHAETNPAGTVRIWVEDNGIGILPEFHQRIFEAFQRLHTTSYAGTGIGLAIVQKGVERMGGRAGVESAPGTGSRFWIELSQATVDAPGRPPIPNHGN